MASRRPSSRASQTRVSGVAHVLPDLAIAAFFFDGVQLTPRSRGSRAAHRAPARARHVVVVSRLPSHLSASQRSAYPQKSMTRFICLIAFAVALLFEATPVAAQESADELIDRGIDLREENRDADALALFERAHQLSPTPRALAQIALAEQALGRWLAAERHMSDALGLTDPWIEERRAPLERALEATRRHLGRVEVTGGVPGAEVVVNGRSAGALPLDGPITVEAGTVVLEVRAAGYLAIQRSIQVAAGSLAREDITLQRRNDADQTEEQVSGSTGSIDQRGDDRPTADHSTLLISGGVSLGVGGVGMVLFATLAGLSLAEYQQVEERCGAARACVESDASALRGFSIGADVSLTFGIAALVTGIVLVVIAGVRGESAPERAHRLRLRNGRATWDTRWRF